MTPLELVARHNAAMADRADWERAGLALSMAGLPTHSDPPKSWDSLAAVAAALEDARELGVERKDARVLDGGANPSHLGSFLPALSVLGFSEDNLIGINLDQNDVPRKVGGATYFRGDVERLSAFPDNHFHTYACLSVIEHGVDPRRFLEEARRVLVPGGSLVVSFDYWPDTVDTHGQMAFGAPVKVFSEIEAMGIAAYARGLGLAPTTAPDYRAWSKPVHWIGMEYTFFNFRLRKPA